MLEPEIPKEIQCCIDQCKELHKHLDELRKKDPCIEYTTAYFQLEAVFKNLKLKGVRNAN